MSIKSESQMGFSTTNMMPRLTLRSHWFQWKPNIEVSAVVFITYPSTLLAQTRSSVRRLATVTCQIADAFSDSRHEVKRPALLPLSYCDVTRNISSVLLRNARWSLQMWWAQHLPARAIILQRPNHVRGLQISQLWLPWWYRLLCNFGQSLNDRDSISAWGRDFIFATAQAL